MRNTKFPVWINKKTIAWALYDFADQAYSVLFITLFLPILITVHLGGTEAHVGITVGVSLFFGAILVPLIGAMSDATGVRIPFLIVTAWLTAIFTVLTGYATLSGALFFASLAHITHLISKDVYDAKMTDIVEEKYYGRVSGFGLSIGYLGAVTTLVVGYFLLNHFGWENIQGIRVSFWQAGMWYIIFSLPIALFLRDDAIWHPNIRSAVKKSLTGVYGTFRRLPKRPQLFQFLIASFFYGNAMNTIVIFLGLFGRESIGLSVKQFFPAFFIMSIGSAIGCIVIGRISDALGPLRTLRYVISFWITVVLSLYSLYFIHSYLLFLFLGGMGGLVFGSVIALGRHVIANIAPKEEMATIFGIDGLTEKSAGIIGPVVFGVLATYHGYPAALASVVVFFTVGLLLLPKQEQ